MSGRVVITGATGLLGREVTEAFRTAGWHVTGTGFTRSNPPAILKVDLGNQEEILKLLDEAKPDVVVHCAANRMPDKCDADPEGTKAINVQATEALALAANSRNILLLYISTDYVFPGREGEAPYEAGSPTEPPNFYGKTKLDGETAVLSTTAKAGLGVVLRIPVLYGKVEASKESAINVLMDSVWKAQEKGAKLFIDDWSIRYPTNTEDVARVILDISTKYTQAADKTSLPHVLQFSSEDRMTKYEICEVFSEIMGLSMDGMAANKQGNDPTSKTQRPYDCHLSTAELKRIGISVHTQDFKAWWCVYPA